MTAPSSAPSPAPDSAPGTPPQGATPTGGSFAPLQQKLFAVLWVATVIGNTGSFVRDVAPRPQATDFVTDGQILKLAGITIQVLGTPGHTPGGVSYRMGDHLFTGDTLFDGDYGRTDLPGGSMAQMRESLRMLLSLHGLRAYPGHGSNFIIP